jgi:GNAT superfamily N-acetyltransferase
MQDPALKIVPAQEADIPLILSLINDLAEYENLKHQVIATASSLREALFGARPGAESLIAHQGDTPAAFALYFYNFSTFLGKPGLYLEDLYVRPAFRSRGIGKQMLKHLARLAVARGCGRFEWAVLDWNQPARDFYESLGAKANSEWINYRLAGDALERLARDDS